MWESTHLRGHDKGAKLDDILGERHACVALAAQQNDKKLKCSLNEIAKGCMRQSELLEGVWRVAGQIRGGSCFRHR